MSAEQKDGVTLIADAIRKEQAERDAKQSATPTETNVSQVTAQFAKATTGKDTTPAANEPNGDEPNGDEPNGDEPNEINNKED